MKKFLVVFVLLCLVLAGAYCGASYFVGGQALKQYEMLLAKKTTPYLDVSTQKYERGVFSSTAVTSIEFKKPAEGQDKAKVLRLELVNSIMHGPLVFFRSSHFNRNVLPVQGVILTRLAPGSEKNPFLADVLEKFPELESSEVLTVLNYDGSGESYFDVPAVKKNLPDAAAGGLFIDWGGLKSSSRFDVGLNEVMGSFTAPNLIVKDAKTNFAVRNVKADLNAHAGLKGFTVGDMNLSCEYIDMDNVDGKPFRLEAATVQLVSGTVADTVSISFSARFEKLNAAGQSCGPFALELEFRNLDADALARCQEDIKQIQKQMPGKSDEEVKEMFTAAYTRLLKGLMTKSPEVELKQLKLATPRGDLDGKLKIALAGSGASMIANPLLALSNLSAGAQASIAEPLLTDILVNSFKGDFQKEAKNDPQQAELLAAGKTADTINALVSQNLLVRDAGTIKASAMYGAGRLVLNGRKINLMDLLR